MANSSLHAAKDAKNDEFYTRLEDINEEMNHYEDKFRGKIVFCNCDDPKWSNFWKYFHLNFEYLGLKKLITTHYEPEEVQSYKIEYTGGNDEDFEVGVRTDLTKNGDFRSPECIELLKEADIVVTNPPFSLFREYIALLMEYDKKFIIIGNVNALTYKEVFPLIKDNKVWFGASIHSGDRKFYVPDDYPLNAAGCGTDSDGRRFIRVKGVRWYTNMDYKARHTDLETTYLYSKKDTLYPDLYPKYDNYDAINVDKTAEIPMDYMKIMGVPITFFDKYNPDQFEIIGLLQSSTDEQAGTPNLRYYNDFIEMRQDGTYTGASGVKANGNPVLQGKSSKGNFLYNPKTNEYVHSAYARIVIKRKVGK